MSKQFNPAVLPSMTLAELAARQANDNHSGAKGRRFRRIQLQDLPTIESGHFDNLKVQTETVRVWLSRMSIDDGAPYDYGVTVERLINGVWTTVDEYMAK